MVGEDPALYRRAMRVDPSELRKFAHNVSPGPPRIEPLLSAAEEARVVADQASKDTVSVARRQRVVALIRRAAEPVGVDAELVALLAAARALPLDREDDRLKARQRLIEIGRSKDPPPEVSRLFEAKRVAPGDAEGFADALLPPKRGPSSFHESGAGIVSAP